MIDALSPVSAAILCVVGMIFVMAALLDFIYYRLPNKLFYVIFYLFPLYIILSLKVHLVSNYLVFVGTMVMGFGLFAATLIGGGDAKLLSAVSLWVGWDHLVPFLIWMLVFGGMIAAVYLIVPGVVHTITARFRAFIQRYPPLRKGVGFLVSDADLIEGEIFAMQQQRMIPYGISIAGAGLMILLKGVV